jgi:hypothetical protein
VELLLLNQSLLSLYCVGLVSGLGNNCVGGYKEKINLSAGLAQWLGGQAGYAESQPTLLLKTKSGFVQDEGTVAVEAAYEQRITFTTRPASWVYQLNHSVKPISFRG